MTKPDAKWLEDLVAEHGTCTAAARAIGWTQPSISNRIKDNPYSAVVIDGELYIKYPNHKMTGPKSKRAA